MRSFYILLACLFFLFTIGIDTLYGHTILGKVTCLASLLNTIGFVLLALPADNK